VLARVEGQFVRNRKQKFCLISFEFLKFIILRFELRGLPRPLFDVVVVVAAAAAAAAAAVVVVVVVYRMLIAFKYNNINCLI